jgi:hypothetical protein
MGRAQKKLGLGVNIFRASFGESDLFDRIFIERAHQSP